MSRRTVAIEDPLYVRLGEGFDKQDIRMEFRYLPAGTFRMGARGEYADEEPIHEVTISAGFYMGATPVTQEQFEVYTRKCKVQHTNGFPGNPQHPAEKMTWQQAVDFCEWLNAETDTGKATGWRAGLPSEAEWEYACRLMKDKNGEPYTVDTEYYIGDGEAALAAVGWYTGNAGGTTHAVRKKEKTSFGLYDLHGNVWEWCRDGWNEHAYQLRRVDEADPVEPGGKDALRVVRGGCWIVSAWDCRAACRNRWNPWFQDGNQGFRVCLFSGPSSCPSGQEAGASSEPRAGDGAGRDAERSRQPEAEMMRRRRQS